MAAYAHLAKRTTANYSKRLEVPDSDLFAPKKVIEEATYILLLSSASLCMMSCLMSSRSC